MKNNLQENQTEENILLREYEDLTNEEEKLETIINCQVRKNQIREKKKEITEKLLILRKTDNLTEKMEEERKTGNHE